MTKKEKEKYAKLKELMDADYAAYNAYRDAAENTHRGTNKYKKLHADWLVASAKVGLEQDRLAKSEGVPRAVILQRCHQAFFKQRRVRRAH